MILAKRATGESEDFRQLFGLASLFEQTTRLVYNNRSPKELQPVQWSALRYFNSAGETARTVTGFSKFINVTKGPASRTIKTLVEQKYVVVTVNPDDARSSFFSLSASGVEKLKFDPLLRLIRAFEKIDSEELAIFSDIIISVGDDLARTSD